MTPPSILEARSALVAKVIDYASGEFTADNMPLRKKWRAAYVDENRTSVMWAKSEIRDWSIRGFREGMRPLLDSKELSEYAAFFPKNDFISLNMEASLGIAAQRFLETRNPAHVDEVFVERERKCTGEPITWTLTAWIHGFRLEHAVRLTSQCELRPVSLEDLAQFRECLDHLRTGLAWHRPPQAVLQIKRRAHSASDLRVELRRILTIMRLYSGLPVHDQGDFIDALTGDNIGSVSPESLKMKSHMPGLLDVARLPAFMSALDPLLETAQAHGTREWIAVERFNEALLHARHPAQEVAVSVTSLEAVLGSDGDSIAHRLAERVAVLLSLKGTEPVPTYDLVKRAYSIRSKYFHGDTVDEARAQAIAERLIHVTRSCVSLVLQLPARASDEIDQAILDLEKREVLRQLVGPLHSPV